ncbi:MAG: hypothetical protein DHS20C13_21860 [Thermodesulfobacteriota bacterium]|nr:MAG: hypothetical protein DHS20C13_21860 [Thermodesulfobacteriota bacterium]
MKSIFSLASLFIITSLLFININTTSANTQLGRIMFETDGRNDILPLFSGNKVAYGKKTLIKTPGTAFVAEKGSELEVLGQNENLTLVIEKGIIHFRIIPHKALVSFNTKNGDFKTPGIVKASTSTIEGTIMVNDKETILELSEGDLEALTDKGIETVNAGDRLIIVSQGDLVETNVEQNGEAVEVASTDSSNDSSEEDDNSLAGAAIFGGVGAAAITGAIIGASTSGNGGDRRASPVIP